MDESFWRGFRSWEKQASEAWGEFIRSPEWIAAANQRLEDWLLFRRQLDEATDQALRANGLPTRAEDNRIQFLIHELTRRVEELEERVRAFTG